MKHYLIVDIGTGNSRVCLTASDGSIICVRQFSNRYERDDAYPDAQFFIPSVWALEFMKCFRAIADEYPDIKPCAISCAGTRQTSVLIDKNGEAFYALPNIDNRGAGYMESIPDQDMLYRATGKWLSEVCALRAYGLREKHPELYERISKMISIDGWIGYIFTGKCTTEPTLGGEFGVYDLDKKGWSIELCDRFGFDYDFLPDIVSAGDVIGEVDKKYKEMFHLSDDCVFIAGGGDTQLAVHSSGCKAGDIVIVSGTTSPVAAKTSGHVYDEAQRVWVDADLRADGYLVEMNPGVTGINYQKIKEFMCPDISYEELERSYSEKTSFKSVASFNSLLFYEKRHLRNGGLFMDSPLADGFDRYDIAYAVLADIACGTYEELYRLCDISGSHPPYALISGGGFRSETLCHMLSDLSGMELRKKPGFEQATVNGIIRILNDHYGERTADADAYTSYKPGESPDGGKLIREYYKVWLQKRTDANRLQ